MEKHDYFSVLKLSCEDLRKDLQTKDLIGEQKLSWYTNPVLKSFRSQVRARIKFTKNTAKY